MNAAPTPLESGFETNESLSVRMLAVLGLMLGTVGLALLPFALEPFYTGSTLSDVHHLTRLDLWLLFSCFTGLGLSSVLLIGALGCFMLKRWARPVMIFYGVCSVLYGLAGFYFFPLWFSQAPGVSAPEVLGVGPAILPPAWAVGTLFGVFSLIAMSRPNIRAALRRPEIETREF